MNEKKAIMRNPTITTCNVTKVFKNSFHSSHRGSIHSIYSANNGEDKNKISDMTFLVLIMIE